MTGNSSRSQGRGWSDQASNRHGWSCGAVPFHNVENGILAESESVADFPIRLAFAGEGTKVPLLPRAGLIGGRYPTIECSGLSQLNPLGAAGVKAANSAAFQRQSIALFKLYFNRDSDSAWKPGDATKDAAREAHCA